MIKFFWNFKLFNHVLKELVVFDFIEPLLFEKDSFGEFCFLRRDWFVIQFVSIGG